MMREPGDRSADGSEDVLDKNPLLVEISRRIAELRKASGLTQSQLGDLSGTQVNTVFKAERGTQDFRILTLAKIAAALGVQLRDLIPADTESRASHPTVTLERIAEVVGNLTREVSEIRHTVAALGKTVAELTRLDS